jgi:hypothetical protein
VEKKSDTTSTNEVKKHLKKGKDSNKYVSGIDNNQIQKLKSVKKLRKLQHVMKSKRTSTSKTGSDGMATPSKLDVYSIIGDRESENHRMLHNIARLHQAKRQHPHNEGERYRRLAKYLEKIRSITLLSSTYNPISVPHDNKMNKRPNRSGNIIFQWE